MNDDTQDESTLPAPTRQKGHEGMAVLPASSENEPKPSGSRGIAILCSIGILVLIASVGAVRFWSNPMSAEERADIGRLRILIGDMTAIMVNGGRMAAFVKNTDECKVITGRMVLFGERASDMAKKSARLCREAEMLAHIDKFSESRTFMNDMHFSDSIEVVLPEEYGLVSRELTVNEYYTYLAKRYLKGASQFMEETKGIVQ